MNNAINILLVEDNEGDIVLTLEALKEAMFFNNVHVVKDGEQALRFLRKQEEFGEAITPDIIFLDINLPKMDGTELLSIIKTNETFRVIPVIMLTTSNAEKDIISAYYHHANCYITKPVDIEKFMEMIHTLKNFWISTAQLPKSYSE